MIAFFNIARQINPHAKALKLIRPATYLLSIGGLGLCVLLAIKLRSEAKPTTEILSAVGSVASFLGLVIALLQIKSVKEITVATQQAIVETRDRLIINISISELGKAFKLIEEIQTYLGNGKYDAAYIRLKDLRILLVQFGGNARFLQITGRENHENLLKNIGVHIINLYDAVFRAKIIRIGVVNQTLENVVGILVAFENELKFDGGAK